MPNTPQPIRPFVYKAYQLPDGWYVKARYLRPHAFSEGQLDDGSKYMSTYIPNK